MRLEQITAWSPIAAIRPGKTEKDPRRPRAPQDERGQPTGDVYAVDPVTGGPEFGTPAEHHTVDIRI
jgi:hypothetical protein